MTENAEQIRSDLGANEPSILALKSFFGPGGAIEKKLGGQSRWGQAEMAFCYNKSLRESHSILLQAPTGTGKTLAYLVPICQYLQQNPKERVVIAVATKQLQNQLERDFQQLSDEFPLLKGASILKGANNYLCLNRLHREAQRPQERREIALELDQLTAHFNQIEHLPHGWQEEMPPNLKVSDATWEKINGEGKCCASLFGCYRKKAKVFTEKAQVVVVNIDLLGYNTKYATNVVPSNGQFEAKPFLILDEAHTLPSKLCAIESADVSIRTVEKAVSLLLEAKPEADLRQRVKSIEARLHDCRQQFVQLYPKDGEYVITPGDSKANPCQQLVQIMGALQGTLETFLRQPLEPEAKEDFQQLSRKMGYGTKALKAYLDRQLEDHVLLLESSTSPTGYKSVRMELKPFDLTEPYQRIWDKFKHHTLISATLIGTSADEARKTFNAPDWRVETFPTPFNYRHQMRIYLPPTRGEIVEPAAIAGRIQNLADITEGRCLALFTNYNTIQAVAQILVPWCAEQQMDLLVQERNISPESLVRRYRKNPRAIILGNQGMGTGIDLRLRGLVITKIPFDQQTPYREQRQKYLEAKGINPFTEDTIPETVRRWKQWWGRLIREESQKGFLILLDPKLNTAYYRNFFLQNLPSESRATHLDDPSYPFPTKEQAMKWLGVEPDPSMEAQNPAKETIALS